MAMAARCSNKMLQRFQRQGSSDDTEAQTIAAWRPPLQFKQSDSSGALAWATCSLAQLRFSTANLCVLLLLGLGSWACMAVWPYIYRGAQNIFYVVHYTTDATLLGRDQARFPAPYCCAGAGCQARRTGRVAVLTYLLSDSYLPLVQQLECTFRKSNPGLELGVLTAAGTLALKGPAARWMERRNLTRVEVPQLAFQNQFTSRYGMNWVKLRALELTQYDAVVLIDSDTAVLGDLSPLFSLPAEFAASWDQTRLLGRLNTRLRGINGGVVLMRPCPAVLHHMLRLLEEHSKLQFTYGAAEQVFLAWYYKYTGMMLPVEYNTMASDSLQGDLTVGGRPPVVVHFTQDKPFRGAVPGKPGHQFLCSEEELQR